MSLVSVPWLQSRNRRIITSTILLAGAAILSGSRAQALPVIPGASGFGIETRAGRGGTVYKVTNLNATGTGSLRACVDGKTPRVCVFEVSGTIRLTDDMKISNPYITIAGQTAPSPGIMLRGGTFRVQTNDVLIQHLRLRVGDDPVGPAPDNRDSLKIEGTDASPRNNIVIDHCSMSWAIDENTSVWGAHDNITLSNNIFAEPLNESLHMSDDGKTRELHGYGVILGTSTNGGRVTMSGNLLAHQVSRNPLARSRELVFVNNLVYDRGDVDYDGQSDVGRITKSTLVGNMFLQGPAYNRATRPVFLHTAGPYSLVTGSRVYVSDNMAPDSGSGIAQLVTFSGGDILSGLLQTSSMPVWNTGLKVVKNASNGVYDEVLQNAGARPSDRDVVDKRIVLSVRARTGGIINCVASNGTTRCNKNGGGWPTLVKNTRTLTLPSNPNSVASNGYTNLENWLHAMDMTLQGVASQESPIAPAALSVD